MHCNREQLHDLCNLFVETLVIKIMTKFFQVLFSILFLYEVPTSNLKVIKYINRVRQLLSVKIGDVNMTVLSLILDIRSTCIVPDATTLINAVLHIQAELNISVVLNVSFTLNRIRQSLFQISLFSFFLR